ncbi:hypothetical protein Tco_0259047, partial [Tanacetum coccineum]
TVKDGEETRVSTEDLVSTDKTKVSTNKPNEGTAEPNKGNVEPNEGTAKPKDGNSDESATPTPTPIVFGDNETIAQVIITVSQNKIDPKDKGKKVLKEEAESDAESEGVNDV